MTKPDTDTEDTGRLVGYARVSTKEQNIKMQRAALERAGVAPDMIFSESASGAKKGRPALRNALRACGPGDTLVVWKLDRLARDSLALLVMLEDLSEQAVKVRSLTETFDAETAAGRFLMQILAASAEFERSVIRERTQAGVDNARADGVQFGAREQFTDAQIRKAYRRVHVPRKIDGVVRAETRVAVCKEMGITTQHLARRFKRYVRDFPDEAAAVKASAEKKRASRRRT